MTAWTVSTTEMVSSAGRPRETGRTEGGEARPMALAMAGASAKGESGGPGAGPGRAPWYALWTRSHCERLVHAQLVAKGYELFLPELETWSSQGGTRRRVSAPMFPGYLFLCHRMDKASYVEVIKARGLVRVIGEQWDRLHAVPDEEIEALQRVVTARVPVLPYPFLKTGQRMRITRGPLTDVEGVLVHSKPNKGLLVLSVNLLSRSVAVEVDCTQVMAA